METQIKKAKAAAKKSQAKKKRKTTGKPFKYMNYTSTQEEIKKYGLDKNGLVPDNSN
jgi:hypothetical protein